MTTTTSTTSTTAAAVVSALGAGSGIDTKSLANSLIAAEKAPRETAINRNITKNESLVSGFAAVKYALTNLKTAFDDLKDRSDFKAISATNSNTSAFTATTTSGADSGNHSVLVNSLATAQRNTGTTGFASSTTAINSGSAISLAVDIAQSSTGTTGFASSTTAINGGAAMTLTLGGTAFSSGVTVAVAAGDDTPAGIVDAINNAGLSVTASLVNTGDATAPYKVVVTGTAGSDYAFTVSSSASGIDFDTTIQSASTSTITIDAGSDTPAGVVDAVNNAGTGLSAQLVNTGDASTPYKVVLTGASGKYNAFSVTSSVSALNFDTSLQTASDASLTVDGIAITSSSNTVSGAISGVTLNLLSTNSTAATVSLTNDTSAAKTKITALVTAYNDAMDLLDEITNPKSTLETYGGTMVGNSSVNAIRNTLRTLVTDDSSTASASGTLTALRDIGVEINSKGRLTTNSVTLDLALNFDFANTVTLLSGNQENQSVYDTEDSGLAGDASKSLITMLSSTGTVAKESANATTRIEKYQDDLTALEDRMAMLLTRYTKQFAAMDSIVGQTRSTQTGLTSTFAGLMAMYTNK
ncbi:MAG: flagellar filament capping protein FliD [Rhodoferax sp.]|nr:flagellar filament capping protein FliD [Rhodoferax sp.]